MELQSKQEDVELNAKLAASNAKIKVLQEEDEFGGYCTKLRYGIKLGYVGYPGLI